MTAQEAGAAAAFKSLSSLNVVQYILADIPFFCIGILSLGIFTFFLFMRRVSSLIFCIHMAALLAFISAILDLIQMLIRGVTAVDSGTDTSSVSGLITVREVGYALSFGLRFLFFWGYVAQPPPGERPKGNAIHNGSWNRWGIFGVVLEVFTLALTIVDPLLQILYRVITALDKIGPLYEVEGSIEIVLSVVFIVKIMLNCWVKKLADRNQVPNSLTLVGYSGILIALGLSALIGVGNVAMFQFSETVLGRFLQAVELYIIIVHMLSSSFCHLRQHAWPWNKVKAEQQRRQPSASGPEITEAKPRLRVITPPVITSPDLLQVVGRNVRLTVGPRGNSTASRLSSWFNIRRISDRIQGRVEETLPHADCTQLWQQDQAERGMASPDDRDTGKDVPDSAIDLESPLTTNAPQTAPWRDPVYTTILCSSQSYGGRRTPTSSVNALQQYATEPAQPSQRVTLNEGQTPVVPRITIPPLAHSRQATIESKYSTGSGSGSTSSSVYGGPAYPAAAATANAGLSPLDEIVITPQDVSHYSDHPARKTIPGGPIESSRSSYLSELIRQQAELDKSIAALRILSPSLKSFIDSAGEEPGNARINSDVSLDSFPAPPWGRSSIVPNPSLDPNYESFLPDRNSARLSRNEEQRPPEEEEVVLAPLKENAVRQESMMLGVPKQHGAEGSIRAPSTVIDAEHAPLNSRSRVNSGGTQYEITSFINGLSHPELHPASISSSFVFGSASDDGRLSLPYISRPFAERSSMASLGSAGGSVIAQPSGLRNVAASIDESHDSDQGSVSEAVITSARRLYPSPPANRYARPVGLPPRPRLNTRDLLTPVDECQRSSPAPST